MPLTEHNTDPGSDRPAPMEPWNLTLRFALEVACVAGIGAGVATATATAAGIAAAVIAVVGWGVFATPDDPSRSGRAPVPTPGILRLGLEVIVFGAGIAGWYATGQVAVAVAITVLVIVHHVGARSRLAWLVARRRAAS